MSDPVDTEALAAEAQSFEDEKTSPELRVRPPARNDDTHRPIVIVAFADGRRRGRIIELLRGDGWNALEAHDAEEIVEMTVSLAPHVLLVDAELRQWAGCRGGASVQAQLVPEAGHGWANLDASRRTLAFLGDHLLAR